MGEGNTVTRAKGGTAEQEVPIEGIDIPDLWHIAMMFREVEEGRATMTFNRVSGKVKVSTGFAKHVADDILETWHLCHDLLRTIREQNNTEGEM